MSISALFDGYNAGYVQDLYERYSRNPDSVPEEWRRIFSGSLSELVAEGLIVADGALAPSQGIFAQPGAADASPVAPVPKAAPAPATSAPPVSPESPASLAPPSSPLDESRLLPLIARAAALVQAFRDHGHQLARIDPLGSDPPGHPQLDPSFFGTTSEDLAEIPASLVLDEGGDEPLSAAIERLRRIYCGSIGYQFEHLEDPHKVRWLWSEVESGRHSQPLEKDEAIRLLDRLSQVEGLERFLHRAYLGQKRFSIEGTDMMLPMLDLAIEEAANTGTEKVVVGMAHRGRLNLLAHIVGTQYDTLLREFEGAPQQAGAPLLLSAGTGDVKYHHGARGSFPLQNGGGVEVRLAPNPSHLEFVNPVVQGMTRAYQYGGNDATDELDHAAVVPFLIHGDAAFAGEGIVAETLNLARLTAYTVGGAVHIIANNQVGFTTNPSAGRSTRYASDVAKGFDIPVLHVNADDPEACLACVRVAMAYRATFHDDIVIDLVGYRRHGHNEGDEPSYTQPILYQKIADHPTVRTLWVEALVERGVITNDEARAKEEEVLETLREAQARVKAEKEGSSIDPLPPAPPQPEPIHAETTVELKALRSVNAAALAVPDGFTIHPKLKRQLAGRGADFGANTALDWGHAETLALGSLLLEGVPIRVTGQDSERGTFSHRHLVLHDAETGARVTPLGEVGEARFEVYNSALSEAAALGFEYGFSTVAQTELVIWEAQFGDFVNVAQVILDQFIASGRSKWGQLSRLTLLLPHGYEGQGPEHSSARLERFLQLCAEDNMRVAYPTTPAQFFHLLRLQALGTPQRPLIVMSPKSLLRHPRATSPVSELTSGGFHRVLPDPVTEGHEEAITRLILCSGKVYYDHLTAEGRQELKHVSVGRVEQLYPFPASEIQALVERYPALEEVIWTQEEPWNMGALSYIGPRLRAVVPRSIRLRHVSRPERASPAEGRFKSHEAKQEKLIRESLHGDE